MPVRTVIERGPEGKRSVAFGIDWPGWSRGARSPELALERGITLLRRGWAFFDGVAARVSPEMR